MPSQAPDKLRLLVILNVFPPDILGGAAVFSDLLYGLSDRGLDITVRCAYPYYPEWKDKTGQNGWYVSRYDDRGVHVERYGLFIPNDPHSLIQRFFYEGSFLLSLVRSLTNRERFDAVGQERLASPAIVVRGLHQTDGERQLPLCRELAHLRGGSRAVMDG